MNKLKINESMKKILDFLVNNKIISIALFLVVALVVFIPLFSGSFQNKEKLDNPFGYYQIILTEKFDIDEGKLVVTNSDILSIEGSDSLNELETTPLYLEQQDKFILTKDMTYVDTVTNQQKHIPRLSELKYSVEGITYTYDNKEKSINNGFLFDGEGTYIFLENVELDVDNQVIDLPAFSFVKKYSSDTLVTYNYDTKESEMIVSYLESEVKHIGYNLDIDDFKIFYKNNTSQRLFTDSTILELA